MSTDKQIEANRLNALHSTGPKSLNGKNVVRLNSVTHGLSAQDATVPGEDGHAFTALAVSFYAALSPTGELQEFLVNRMIASSWKLRRLNRIESDVFDYQASSDWVVKEDHVRNFGGDGEDPTIAVQSSEPPVPPRDIRLGLSFIRGATDFARLSRYEGRIERSFYRALHELQRLQALAAGHPPPPPTTLDVNVDVDADLDPDPPDPA